MTRVLVVDDEPQILRALAINLRARRYEVVTANLFSELLIAALPTLRHALRAKGYLIASGILHKQTEAVARALHRNAFQVEKQRRRGKWIAFLAARRKPS